MHKLALADWDGTLRSGFTLQAWTRFLAKHGVISPDVIDDLASLFAMFRSHRLSHDDLSRQTSLVYANSLKGSSTEQVQRLAYDFVQEDASCLLSFTEPLLRRLGCYDVPVLVISGTPFEVLLAYQARLPIYDVVGLTLYTRDGIYTGEINVNPGYVQGKQVVINATLRLSQLKVVLAMGNSDSDMPLFEIAPYNIIVDNALLTVPAIAFHILSRTCDPSEVVALVDRIMVQT